MDRLANAERDKNKPYCNYGRNSVLMTSGNCENIINIVSEIVRYTSLAYVSTYAERRDCGGIRFVCR